MPPGSKAEVALHLAKRRLGVSRCVEGCEGLGTFEEDEEILERSSRCIAQLCSFAREWRVLYVANDPMRAVEYFTDDSTSYRLVLRVDYTKNRQDYLSPPVGVLSLVGHVRFVARLK